MAAEFKEEISDEEIRKQYVEYHYYNSPEGGPYPIDEALKALGVKCDYDIVFEEISSRGNKSCTFGEYTLPNNAKYKAIDFVNFLFGHDEDYNKTLVNTDLIYDLIIEKYPIKNTTFAHYAELANEFLPTDNDGINTYSHSFNILLVVVVLVVLLVVVVLLVDLYPNTNDLIRSIVILLGGINLIFFNFNIVDSFITSLIRLSYDVILL
jgi:hypothetical protein